MAKEDPICSGCGLSIRGEIWTIALGRVGDHHQIDPVNVPIHRNVDCATTYTLQFLARVAQAEE